MSEVTCWVMMKKLTRRMQKIEPKQMPVICWLQVPESFLLCCVVALRTFVPTISNQRITKEKRAKELIKYFLELKISTVQSTSNRSYLFARKHEYFAFCAPLSRIGSAIGAFPAVATLWAVEFSEASFSALIWCGDEGAHFSEMRVVYYYDSKLFRLLIRNL